MDLKQTGIFALMTKRMDYATQRQTVLSKNVANSDTPNYQPSDLVPFDQLVEKEMKARHRAQTSGAGLMSTNSKHLQPAMDLSSPNAAEQKETYEISPSGNGVILEEQMMKIADNAMDYNTMTNLYSKYIGMMKTAIGRTGS